MNAAKDLRGYAICTEPRTGSGYLCRILTSTGRLGRPLEYFNGPGMARLQPDYPQSPEGQLPQILRQGATENGVYGFKIFSAAFDRAAGTLWTRRLPDLHFIWLTRRDLLGQALSAVRAAQTEQYSAADEPVSEPFYDRAWILAELHRAALAQARWAAWFARCGLEPLHLCYEEIVAQPQQAANAVARQVGLEGPATVDFRQIEGGMQRDSTSLEWRTRFLAESHDQTRLDRVSPPGFPAQMTARMTRRLRKWARRTRARGG